MLSEGDLMRRSEIGTERRQSWWLKLLTLPEIEARDFVKAHAVKVADVMTRQMVTATESHTLGEVASLLEKHGIKRVPIVRDKRVIGIVSRAKLLQAFARASAEPDRETTGDDQATRERIVEQIRALPWGMPWLLTVRYRTAWQSFGDPSTPRSSGRPFVWPRNAFRA